MPKHSKDRHRQAGRTVRVGSKVCGMGKRVQKDKTGEEKMAAVVEQLKKIADEAGLNVTEDQLKAIAQTAYNAMKAGEKATPQNRWKHSQLHQLQR